ncbi:MAG TPA: hypothetical protein PK878_15925 [bacterium]|nr:hypothetical protein [bacterium]HOL96452.1 hypothetical protein [bacterium]HPP02887.1 hypothetical protein [bacterium]HXK93163.1 hypothetical protein [bacterium]
MKIPLFLIMALLIVCKIAARAHARWNAPGREASLNLDELIQEMRADDLRAAAQWVQTAKPADRENDTPDSNPVWNPTLHSESFHS